MAHAATAALRSLAALAACLAMLTFGAGHIGVAGTPAAEVVALSAHGETASRHDHGAGRHAGGGTTQCCPTLPDAMAVPRPTEGVAQVAATAPAALRGLRTIPRTPPPRAA